MAYAFGAEDILAALGLVVEDCEVQDSGADTQSDYAGTQDKDGKHIDAAESEFNKRTEKTITVKTIDPTAAATATFVLGGVGTANVVITQFALKKAYNENASLQVTAHLHVDTESGAVHLAAPVSEEIELALGFGVDEALLGGTLKDLQSQSLSGLMEHIDKLSNMGKFLVGASTGLKFECTEEYVDSGADVVVAAPWHQDSQSKKTANKDFYTRSVKAHAYSLTVPAP